MGTLLNATVRTFSDFGSAMAAVRRSQPDCIVVDLGGKGAPGAQFIHEIRVGASSQLLPVFTTTTDSYPETSSSSAYTAGADEVFVRPYTASELALAVSRALNIVTDPDVVLVFHGAENPSFANQMNDYFTQSNWGLET